MICGHYADYKLYNKIMRTSSYKEYDEGVPYSMSSVTCLFFGRRNKLKSFQAR